MLIFRRKKVVKGPGTLSTARVRKLHVVTTAKFVGTTRPLVPVLQELGIKLVTIPWEKFLGETALPFGAYAFGDFDRIHPWMIELAASRHDALIAAGAPVMNDPRRFLTRAALIRSLYALGVNRFTCWLPAFGERPTRYPVFLRTLAAHRGVLGGLLHSPDEVEAALNDALAEGYTITDLGLIEYMAKADPVVGHFQKHAAYRIGDRVLRALTVNDDSWVAKIGVPGRAEDATYAHELAEMTDYPHEDVIRRVTDLCGCTFGRVDFGIVDGRTEIYEMNSNPRFGFPADDHPNANRRASGALSRVQLSAAFDAVVPDADDRVIDISHLKLWLKDKP
jgi:hypothetical protein